MASGMKGMLVSLLLGISIFGVILGGYFDLRGVIDFNGATSSLTSGMGITADSFIRVAIYISIMKSFLEEFFCGFVGKNAGGANGRQDYSKIPGNKTGGIDHILTDMRIRAAY